MFNSILTFCKKNCIFLSNKIVNLLHRITRNHVPLQSLAHAITCLTNPLASRPKARTCTLYPLPRPPCAPERPFKLKLKMKTKCKRTREKNVNKLSIVQHHRTATRCSKVVYSLVSNLMVENVMLNTATAVVIKQNAKPIQYTIQLKAISMHISTTNDSD